MIQKTTKIICDNCGHGIYDFVEDLTYREIASRCKEENIAIIRYKPGRRAPLTFCDEKCLEEYEEKYQKELEEKGIKVENEKTI